MRVALGAVVTLVASAAGAVVGATPAAASVSGWETIRGVPSATNSDILKKSTANCPANKVVVAVGYEMNGSTGDIILDGVARVGMQSPRPGERQSHRRRGQRSTA